MDNTFGSLLSSAIIVNSTHPAPEGVVVPDKRQFRTYTFWADGHATSIRVAESNGQLFIRSVSTDFCSKHGSIKIVDNNEESV